jgi:hypothetical protein
VLAALCRSSDRAVAEWAAALLRGEWASGDAMVTSRPVCVGVSAMSLTKERDDE